MSDLQVILQAFDDAWDHPYESLASALEGVTEEEAFWQAPAYADQEPEEGWPPPGTIAWQVAHLSHCKRHYRDILQHGDPSSRPEVRSWKPQPGFEALLNRLQEAHAAQRMVILGLTDDQLDAVPAQEVMPTRRFLAMCTRHDAWHAAQIAVARRLYRSR